MAFVPSVEAARAAFRAMAQRKGWAIAFTDIRLIDAGLFRGATISREQAGQLLAELG